MLHMNAAAKLVLSDFKENRIVKYAKKGNFGHIHYAIMAKLIFLLNYNDIIINIYNDVILKCLYVANVFFISMFFLPRDKKV